LKPLAFAFLVSTTALAQVGPLPEVDRSKIEYKSVADALEGLRAKSGVDISIQGGWTIAHEASRHALWSFTPSAHPVHPTVVKRTVIERDGQVFIDMDVICQARKEPCDALVREFIQLNDGMRAEMAAKAQPVAPADSPAARARR
jgi:hypothetical protein